MRTITRRPNFPILIIKILGPLIGLILSLIVIVYLVVNLFHWMLPFLGIALLFLFIVSAFQMMGGGMDLSAAVSGAFGSLFKCVMVIMKFIRQTISQWFQTVVTQMTTVNPNARQLTVADIICTDDSGNVFSVQITGDILTGGLPAVGHRLRVEGVPANPRHLWNVTMDNIEITWRRPSIMGY